MTEDEHKDTAAAFLDHVVAHYRQRGVLVQRAMTDNGSCYCSRDFLTTCARHGVRHVFTRPYTPRTNGKAERFIKTCLREWACAVSYNSSRQRREALAAWLHHYNWHRPHTVILPPNLGHPSKRRVLARTAPG